MRKYQSNWWIYTWRAQSRTGPATSESRRYDRLYYVNRARICLPFLAISGDIYRGLWRPNGWIDRSITVDGSWFDDSRYIRLFALEKNDRKILSAPSIPFVCFYRWDNRSAKQNQRNEDHVEDTDSWLLCETYGSWMDITVKVNRSRFSY